MGYRRSHTESGATMVEAALSLLVLVFIVLGAIDVLRVSIHLESGQYAVNEAARWATYGDLYGGAASRTESLKLKVRDVAGSIGLRIDPANVDVCPMPLGSCSPESTLDSGSFFMVRARTNFAFLSLAGFTQPILFEAVDQNEPF